MAHRSVLVVASFVTSFILCLCLFSGSQAAKKDSPFHWRRPRRLMPWLKGPNMCAVEEVQGTGSKYYSECMTYMPRKICEKPTFIRYHCCTGFERIEGKKGCQGVKPMANLMDTAKHLYLREFRSYVKKGGLENMLEDNGTYTVFAPQNQAFSSRNLPTHLRKNFTSGNPENILLGHMVNGRHYLGDFINGIGLNSLHKDWPLKINRYSNRMTTVNCARIILADQIATNGVLHVTDKVVQPVDPKERLLDRLVRDDRTGELVTALYVSKLFDMLRDESRFLTVFAPTDAAFRNAPRDLAARFLNDPETLKQLIRYHIVEDSICSAAILGQSTLTTAEGQRINVSCDARNHFNVNGAPVIEEDIVTSNGIIHIIDHLLVPDVAKSLRDVMVELHVRDFLEYARQAGALDVLTGKTEGNFTIFVPTLEAFEALTTEQLRLLRNYPAAVKKIVLYHIVPGRISTRSFVGDALLQTNSGAEDKLRLSVHHHGFSVNGADVVSSNHEAGNGMIHLINKVLIPPEGTAVDRVKEESKLSTFLNILQTSNMDTQLIDIGGNFTIFAPTNDAFDSLETSYLDHLLANTGRGQLNKFLQYHILPHPIYQSVLRQKLTYRLKSLTGDWVSLSRESEDEPVVVNENSKIMGDGVEALNGIVYMVDEVLRCPCLDSTNNSVTL